MPRDLPVRDVMTTEVVAFRPADSVDDAAERLVAAGVDAGPVVDDDGRVLGMLSATDLMVRESELHLPTVVSFLGATLELPWAKRRFDEDVEKALGSKVSDVMTQGAETCSPDDTLETAATRMHDHEVSRLPVIDPDGLLVGIIARGDILRAMVRGDDASADGIR